jgi:hypothetical protein
MHFDAIERFEREMGLPDRWYFSLMGESDWSFVIKLHALFEAALTHVLESKVQPAAAGKFVGGLNLGGQFGKLALADELRLLEEKELRFLRALSQMRNGCVHDIRNVGFTIAGYFAAMNDSQQERFVALLRDYFSPTMAKGTEQMTRDMFIRGDLKLSLWVVASRILADLFQLREVAADLEKLNSGFGSGAFGERCKGGELGVDLFSRQVPRPRHRRALSGFVKGATCLHPSPPFWRRAVNLSKRSSWQRRSKSRARPAMLYMATTSW